MPSLATTANGGAGMVGSGNLTSSKFPEILDSRIIRIISCININIQTNLNMAIFIGSEYFKIPSSATSACTGPGNLTTSEYQRIFVIQLSAVSLLFKPASFLPTLLIIAMKKY